ncbi:MAG: aldo/keto reductase [Saprospiraceae bacterium]|nr:aldo/keto reductase [Saprospiraceae bacterium]
MKKISFGRNQYSQLILGTVQLGMNYGISNAMGQPNRNQGIGIIHQALDLGVNTFDTAREYGTAEDILAAAKGENEEQRALYVFTKFRINPEHEADLEKSWKEALEIVRKSLQVLNCKKVSGVLFHRSPLNDLEKFSKILPEIIRRLKENKLIEYGGLSAHYPGDILYALDEADLEIIQVPCNLFDHRFLRLVPAKLKDKLIVARSVFLQGLFFLNPDKLSGAMEVAREPLIRLREIARHYDRTIAQLAVAFVRDQPQVDCLVIGALTPDQIIENINLVNQSAVSKRVCEEIKNSFSEMDQFIITPALWPQDKLL